MAYRDRLFSAASSSAYVGLDVSAFAFISLLIPPLRAIMVSIECWNRFLVATLEKIERFL